MIIKKIQDLIDEVNFEVILPLKNGIDIFSLCELKNTINLKIFLKKTDKYFISFSKMIFRTMKDMPIKHYVFLQ